MGPSLQAGNEDSVALGRNYCSWDETTLGAKGQDPHRKDQTLSTPFLSSSLQPFHLLLARKKLTRWDKREIQGGKGEKEKKGRGKGERVRERRKM